MTGPSLDVVLNHVQACWPHQQIITMRQTFDGFMRERLEQDPMFQEHVDKGMYYKICMAAREKGLMIVHIDGPRWLTNTAKSQMYSYPQNSWSEDIYEARAVTIPAMVFAEQVA